MRVGVLTGGGDCPGLNAVIRAVVRRGVAEYGYDFVGFRDGWKGPLEGLTVPLDIPAVRGILPRGGTILGSSRTNPIKVEGGIERIERNLEDLGIDALVAIGGEDFTVRGGTSYGADRRKGGQGGFLEDLAANYRIPLVNLSDGSGGSVASIKKRGHAVFPGVHGFEKSVELLGIVPVVSAVLGVAAGGPAGRAILSHWSVRVTGQSQIFAAGPSHLTDSVPRYFPDWHRFAGQQGFVGRKPAAGNDHGICRDSISFG